MPNIHHSLRWDSISNNTIHSSTSDTKTLSLLGWTRDVHLDSAARSFFGDRLLEVEPDLFRTFLDFDDNSWKFTYRLPLFMSQDMYRAIEKLIDAFTAYFELPMEERSGSAWFVQTLETEMRQVGIGSSYIASDDVLGVCPSLVLKADSNFVFLSANKIDFQNKWECLQSVFLGLESSPPRSGTSFNYPK